MKIRFFGPLLCGGMLLLAASAFAGEPIIGPMGSPDNGSKVGKKENTRKSRSEVNDSHDRYQAKTRLAPKQDVVIDPPILDLPVNPTR